MVASFKKDCRERKTYRSYVTLQRETETAVRRQSVAFCVRLFRRIQTKIVKSLSPI